MTIKLKGNVKLHKLLCSGVVIFVLIIVLLIQSTSASSSDEMIKFKDENLWHGAVKRIIRSLKEILERGDDSSGASVTSVIKVTSSTEITDVMSSRRIDPFPSIAIEMILRSLNGLFEFHIRDNDQIKAMERIQNNAVLIVSKIVTIREMEKFLLSFEIDSSKTLAIIIRETSMNNINDIKLMFDIVWRKFMLNVVVISVAMDGTSVAIFKPSAPFVEDFCGQVHPVECSRSDVDDIFTIVRNFHLCKLRVAVFQAPPYMIINRINHQNGQIIDVDGVDGNILKILAKKFNFTLDFIFVSEDVRWGEIRADSTASGALSLLLNKSVDLSLGMFSKTMRRVNLLSTSVTYAQSNLIMIVPPGQEFSAFSKLFRGFDKSFWYMLCSLMLLVVIITLILTSISAQKCQRQRCRDFRDFILGSENRTPFLNIIIVVVGLSCHRLPRRNFARSLLMLFIVMWLIIRSLYQAVLYKNLQASERKLPVQSLEESLKLNFVYYMLASTSENIVYLPEVHHRRIVVSRNESEGIILQKFTDPNLKAAFLGGIDIVKYSNKKNLYGRSMDICPQALMLRQFGVFYPRDSYLVSLFDVVLLRLVDSGLVEHWKSTLIDVKIQKNFKSPRKITLEHFIIVFQILGFGIGLASITFIVELLSMKTNRMREILSMLV